MKLTDQFSWRYSPLGCINFYGRAVRVGSADIDNMFPNKSEESNEYVCLNIFDKVTYVYVAVRVR